MSQVDTYDARDATEATDRITISKKLRKYSKLIKSKKKRNKKAPTPEEERYVDELDHSIPPESFPRTSVEETGTLEETVTLEETGTQNVQNNKKTTSDNNKSKKDKYRKGVLVATELITVILEHHGEINNETMNAVLASLLNGKETVPHSSKGQKALKKATKNDRNFVEMAMSAAESAQDMGGNREEMMTASSSVLACRGLKEYQGFKFERSHMLAISEAAAQDAMKNKVRDRDSQVRDRESHYYSDDSDDELNTNDDRDSVIIGITSFDSIDQIRTGGLKAWRENLGECFSYGFAEALGCVGNSLVTASDKTTKKIEETVINDYLIHNGVESYDLVGEHAEWQKSVADDVDFVELEARFERYFYTVATAKGTCTLEWPSGKKFLKQKRNVGGRKIASSKEARAEMGI